MSAAAARFAAAIRRGGGEAELVREGERFPFPASIQPQAGAAGEYADVIGAGGVLLYTIYAPCGTAADLLATGDAVVYRNRRYRLLKTQEQCFGGVPVYHSGVLRDEGGE